MVQCSGAVKSSPSKMRESKLGKVQLGNMGHMATSPGMFLSVKSNYHRTAHWQEAGEAGASSSFVGDGLPIGVSNFP